MAETVTVAGKQMNKRVVYIAGAGALGVVGYAYWTRRPTGPPTEEKTLPEPVETPTDVTDFGVTGGTTTAQPTTNADWTQLAISRLIDIGIDAPAVASALGKFLARKPLNKTEANLVRQAIAVAGLPPVGGPWVVIEETPGGTPGPPPTRAKMHIGLHSRSEHSGIRWAWNKVPGARYYHVWPESGGRQHARRTVSGTTWAWHGLRPNHTYALTVVAIGSGGKEISFRDRDLATTTR